MHVAVKESQLENVGLGHDAAAEHDEDRVVTSGTKCPVESAETLGEFVDTDLFEELADTSCERG
jgi:hypothetical protein